MSKVVQLVADSVVVNCLVVAIDAVVAADGNSVSWGEERLAAPPGGRFMDVGGAQIGWIVAGGTLVPPAAPAAPPVDLAAYAAARRWQAEQVGTIWMGWPIHTDDRSQGKYLSELQAISLGVRKENLGWKFADGVFRPVSNAEFPQLAIAAREHVLTVFDIEAAVLTEIEAGTITTAAEIDAAFE